MLAIRHHYHSQLIPIKSIPPCLDAASLTTCSWAGGLIAMCVIIYRLMWHLACTRFRVWRSTFSGLSAIASSSLCLSVCLFHVWPAAEWSDSSLVPCDWCCVSSAIRGCCNCMHKQQEPWTNCYHYCSVTGEQVLHGMWRDFRVPLEIFNWPSVIGNTLDLSPWSVAMYARRANSHGLIVTITAWWQDSKNFIACDWNVGTSHDNGGTVIGLQWKYIGFESMVCCNIVCTRKWSD